MDLDHIRALVAAEEIRYTDKFDRMLQARTFSQQQAIDVVMRGHVVDEERRKGRPCKYVLQGYVARVGTRLDELVVEIAATDVAIFITGYWPGDGTRKRK